MIAIKKSRTLVKIAYVWTHRSPGKQGRKGAKKGKTGASAKGDDEDPTVQKEGTITGLALE